MCGICNTRHPAYRRISHHIYLLPRYASEAPPWHSSLIHPGPGPCNCCANNKAFHIIALSIGTDGFAATGSSSWPKPRKPRISPACPCHGKFVSGMRVLVRELARKQRAGQVLDGHVAQAVLQPSTHSCGHGRGWLTSTATAGAAAAAAAAAAAGLCRRIICLSQRKQQC